MGKKSREDYIREVANYKSQNLEYEKRFKRVTELIKNRHIIDDKLLNKILDILEGRK